MISPATLACQLVLLLCGCGLNNHVVEILWMQISHYRSGRHYLTVDILVFQSYNLASPSFAMLPSLRCKFVLQKCQLGSHSPQNTDCILPVVAFDNGFCLLQKEASLMRMRAMHICGNKTEYQTIVRNGTSLGKWKQQLLLYEPSYHQPWVLVSLQYQL